MKALRIHTYGELENLILEEVRVTEVGLNEVLWEA
jgi:hypothetical protein